MSNTKIYFASDQHFGAPNQKDSFIREKIFLDWLCEIEKDVTTLFLLGDLFDFWFEYEKVVPKGFVRILGKLASISDRGIPIYFFVGNHDLWMTDYFEKELNIKVFHEPQFFSFNNKSFFIGHGDGKGPGDLGYKRMKKVFTSPFFQFLFKWLHPDIGVRIAQHLSIKNKLISGKEDIHFLGNDNEWLLQYSKRKLENQYFDYSVFGHRHLPLEIPLSDTSTYFNLGDWIHYFTYGVFDGEKFELKKFR